MFDYVIDEFKSIFPFIINVDFTSGAELSDNNSFSPLLIFQERNVKESIYLHDLSSGLIKVLLIMTDISTLPEESIYIIDEYENSLGMNAINFLPDFIRSYSSKIQFITTSHHPYLINNIPIDDWVVFGRNGSNVAVRLGENLVSRYGASKQDAFVKLINDPFYRGY